jgi:hypothetical protein
MAARKRECPRTDVIKAKRLRGHEPAY